jgi:hypothetical protein
MYTIQQPTAGYTQQPAQPQYVQQQATYDYSSSHNIINNMNFAPSDVSYIKQYQYNA